jgi:hypothetical protein
MDDPENVENRNGGNGGDLVKHTVYVTVLDYLLARVPWSNGLRVRECRAGRDSRRALLECLYEPVGDDVGVPLHDIQRASQTTLCVWPEKANDLAWYSGSPVLNAWQLSQSGSAKHRLDLMSSLQRHEISFGAYLAHQASISGN